MTIQPVIDWIKSFRYKAAVAMEWLSSIELFGHKFATYYSHPNRVRTYRSISPDVFVGFGASELMAELAAFSQHKKSKLVLLAASDSDLSAEYVPESRKRNAYGCRANYCHYSIVSADRLIVQNDYQKQAAAQHFDKPSQIILNPIAIPEEPVPGRDARDIFLWIGKADDVKRPLLVFELARACPSRRFVVICNPNRPEIEQQMTASTPDNVDLIPAAGRDEIDRLMRRAIAFVNTSRFEGFPNTFLEACRAGTPIFALAVNPNQVLTRHQCGIFANGDLGRVAQEIERVAENAQAWAEMSANARRYVEGHHDNERIIDQFEIVLQEVVKA